MDEICSGPNCKTRNADIYVNSNLETPNGAVAVPHTLDIDISQMILMNADDFPAQPKHDDHNLDQPIDLPGFTSGFLYYPLAVKLNDVCSEVLDPMYNTKIIIQTPRVTID